MNTLFDGVFSPACLITATGAFCTEAVIASLRRHSSARLIGTNIQPPEWCATSTLLDAAYQVPPARDVAAYIRRVLSICEAERVTHVLPQIDPEIDAFALHHELFTSRGITLCMPPLDTIHIARDKWRVFQAFEDVQGIRAIPTWRLQDLPVPGLELPLIAKPCDGRNCEGLVRIHDPDYLRYIQDKCQDREYIVQPLLPGEVCVVDVVRHAGTGQWAGMARQELVRTSNGAGLTVQMLPDASLVEAAGRVAQVLGVNGCINMEFLVHEGDALLMDVNPRFSGGIAFTRLSGYDMVLNHFRCFSRSELDAPVVPAPAIHARHYVEVTTVSGE